MTVPIGKHGRDPGADAVGCRRQHQGLQRRGVGQPQDRQRHQHADQQRDRGELPVVRVDDRPGPGEFRFARGVEDTPIRTDAAFEELPGLIDRLDDVVLHADGFGAGDEIAQHRGLLERTWIGVEQIVAGARPAEFGDDDPLARELVAQEIVAIDGLIHRLLVGEIFPIRQNVGGDEIHRRGQRRLVAWSLVEIVAPDVPDLARRHRHVDRLLDPLDHLDEVFDLLLAAVDRLVADDDCDHIAVVPGEIDRGLDLALVAVDILVDPGADRHLEAELRRDRGNQFDAAGRGVESDRPGDGRELLQVGANLLDAWDVVDVGVGGALEGGVGHARQHAGEIGCLLLILQKTPERGVGSAHKQ